MPRKLRLAYCAHSLRSDWNNGNAHFLRGLLRAMRQIGHEVTAFEPEAEWSFDHLSEEAEGQRSLQQFLEIYSDLDVQTYASTQSKELWREKLRGIEVVLLHEWNPPAFAQVLLQLRDELGYKLLFHDTHHRASSSPEQMQRFGLLRFDGIVSFGEALSQIYRDRFGIEHVWTLHEAADISVFKPCADVQRERALVWIGNWAEGERSAELREFLLNPAAALRSTASTTVFGVRYPREGLQALQQAGVQYGGYIANLDAPAVYARAAATVHIPRQQYTQAMTGIPTIRVFEALACGIPLVSAPWHDSETLFRPGDFAWAGNASEMTAALRHILLEPAAAADQAQRGLETVLSRHTCAHRAHELTAICEEALQ